jgi:hypothetical protein
MSTQPVPPGGVVIPPAPAPRHAFGWPPGSIRAILVLIVVGLVCGLMLLGRDRQGQPIPIPPYLLYLLFLAVGYYFAARGHAPRPPGVPPPLWLPAGSIRLIIIAALTATVAWKMVDDRLGLEGQLRQTVTAFTDQPLLPLVTLGGFFAGVVVRAIIGRHERSAWAQNMEAWFALIAVVLMSIAALIHLVIDPSMADRLYLPSWESFLAGLVAFYFGVRS